MLKTKSHKIAFYIRVSTEEQAENPEGSIRNQEERLKATVSLKNMEGHFGEVVEVFIDRAKSGKDTNRPELQRLLTAIKKKEINLVMVSELSRLSRSIKDFSQMWEMMRANGCGFYSLRENFDTTTAAGEMVLFTVANIAQFERRQCSERVSANFQARAARGLYNGGVIPLGYKLIEEKPGYLQVDEDAAEVVKTAFKAFLDQGTLSLAAKWLNANSYKMKREVRGGNNRPRHAHFTVDNLHQLITNKSYTGVRKYLHRGEVKETKAVWSAIIDKDTFDRVQEKLKANYCRKKPPGGNRFPFQLTGLVFCEACGERMVGKSAHGNGGKIPYYEHGWSTKIKGCLVKPVYDCNPFRIQAKKLEPVVWQSVNELLSLPSFADEVVANAAKFHKKVAVTSQAKRIQEKINGLEGQLEVLAARLSELPKSVSAAPIYKQMEKLEAYKIEEQSLLTEAQAKEIRNDMPVTLKTFKTYLEALKQIANMEDSELTREKLIRALVRRILITPTGAKIEFFAGQNHFEMEMIRQEEDKFDQAVGSNSLTIGGP